MKKIGLLACLATSGLIGAIQAPSAAEISNTFNVTATVIDTCTVADFAELAFGSIGPKQSAIADTSVAINCTGATTLDSVYLSMGDHEDSGTRRLASATPDYIPYTLKMGASSATANEATDGATNLKSRMGHLFPVGAPYDWNAIIYATIDSSATARPAGEYSDTVILTVNYYNGLPPD